MRGAQMINPNNIGIPNFSDCHMPELGLYGKIDPSTDFPRALKRVGQGFIIEKEQHKKGTSFDPIVLVKEFETLKKENKFLKARIGKIEDDLSKKSVEGVHNFILSHSAINEIWDEEDDTL